MKTFRRTLAGVFGGLCGAGAGAVLEEEEQRVQGMGSSSTGQQKQRRPSKQAKQANKKGAKGTFAHMRDLSTVSNNSSCGSHHEAVNWDQLSENGAHPSRPLLVSPANPCLVYRPAKHFSHCKVFGA